MAAPPWLGRSMLCKRNVFWWFLTSTDWSKDFFCLWVARWWDLIHLKFSGIVTFDVLFLENSLVCEPQFPLPSLFICRPNAGKPCRASTKSCIMFTKRSNIVLPPWLEPWRRPKCYRQVDTAQPPMNKCPVLAFPTLPCSQEAVCIVGYSQVQNQGTHIKQRLCLIIPAFLQP